MPIRTCIRCGVVLTKRNWYPSGQKNYSYICKTCQKTPISTNKCECGCGQVVSEGSQYVHGHWSHTLKGQEHIKKVGKEQTTKWNNSPEGKAQIAQLSEKWARSPEGRANAKFQGKKMGYEWSHSIKGKTWLNEFNNSPETKARASERMRMIATKWSNSPEGQANRLKATLAQRNRPSQLEQRVFALFLHYGLPFDFIGDRRSNSIGGKYPDFMHREEKIVIEIGHKREKEFRYNKKTEKAGNPPYSPVGLYWQQYEKARIEHFRKNATNASCSGQTWMTKRWFSRSA